MTWRRSWYSWYSLPCFLPVAEVGEAIVDDIMISWGFHADGGTLCVLGIWTSHVSFADRKTSVLFAVLDECPLDVILGLD